MLSQTSVELICSLSDAWFSLAMILQWYNYIAKQDDEMFSSALRGWNDCMALSNNNNLTIKSKHIYLGLRFGGPIWIKKLFESIDLQGLCSMYTSMQGHFPSDPPSWLYLFCLIQAEFDLAISVWTQLSCRHCNVLFISLVTLMANGTL